MSVIEKLMNLTKHEKEETTIFYNLSYLKIRVNKDAHNVYQGKPSKTSLSFLLHSKATYSLAK